MKRFKKLTGILLTLTLMLALAACSRKPATESMDEEPAKSTDTVMSSNLAAKENTQSTVQTENKLDTSERVDLVFYVMGDAPADEKKVEDIKKNHMNL